MIYGMDTTTEEGRAAYKAEYDYISEMAPQIVRKEDMTYPHEMPLSISNEPHFRRCFQHYRNWSFSAALAGAVENGSIADEDANTAMKFLGMKSNDRRVPSFEVYVLIKTGKITCLESDADYQTTMKVMEEMGLGQITFDDKTAEPKIEQFWKSYDEIFDMTEEGMHESMDLFITDPNNLKAVEALMNLRSMELESEDAAPEIDEEGNVVEKVAEEDAAAAKLE